MGHSKNHGRRGLTLPLPLRAKILKVSVGSRAGGQSAVAKADYIEREGRAATAPSTGRGWCDCRGPRSPAASRCC